MEKEDREWLKANRPWDYDASFGDPVTGFSGTEDSGCLWIIIVGVLILFVWGLVKFI
jgi:hypothetical protein|tara:strand:- start:19 stop:189 length:171 start_codon:yes stop_codon:yes gene_type:complete